MKIVCTVKEFAALVKGCAALSSQCNCIKCPLQEMCERDGVEQFISAGDIIDEKTDVLYLNDEPTHLWRAEAPAEEED